VRGLDPPDVDVLPFGFRPVPPDWRAIRRRLPFVVSALLPLAILWVSLSLPLQRKGWLLGVVLVVVLVRALESVDRLLLLLPPLVVLLPITGNFLHGPRIAPAEGAILLAVVVWLAAGRRDELPPTPLATLVALACAAVATGALGALVGALPVAVIPAAAMDLVRNLAAPGYAHAAIPIRAALVALAGLFGLVAARRAAVRFGPTAATSMIVAGGAGVGLYGLLEGAFGWKLWPPEIYEAASGRLRVVSTCQDPNSAASFLSLALFPAVAFALSRRGFARVAATAAAVAMAATLLLTGSRAAWVATAAVGLLLAARLFRRLFRSDPRRARRSAGGAVALIVLGIVSVAVAPGGTGEVVRGRARTLLSPGESLRALGAGRSGFWTAGVRMIAAEPLFGVGPGRVPARFREFRPATLSVDVENVHSWPLQVVAELGLPGGFLVLAPLVLLLSLLPQAFRKLLRGEGRPEVLALAPGIAAFTISGLVAHPWLLPEMQVVFWGAAGLLLGELRPVEPGASLGRVVRIGIGVLVLWGTCSVGRAVLAPSGGRGTWGFWGWEEGGGEWAWVGPSAFGPIGRPSSRTFPLSLRRITNAPEAKLVPVEARFLGGEWVRGELEGRNWLRLELPVPPARKENGKDSGVVYCQIRVERPWCPARVEGTDRRILGAELARPGSR
jgi:O-antigen ligase